MLKKKTKASLALLIIVLLLAACTQEESNKEVLEKVLEHQLNGPDEKFVELVMDPKYKTVADNKEENKELNQYVEDVYGPYFVESYLDSFITTSGTTYPVVAEHSGHKLYLKDLKIEQSEKMSNRYTFVAIVGYQKDSEEEKTANISGEVIFSKEEQGKIGKFEYRDEEGFVYTLMNDRNE